MRRISRAWSSVTGGSDALGAVAITVEADEAVWEHGALVTSLSEEIVSFGQLYRDLYERAWRVETAQANDQVLFAICGGAALVAAVIALFVPSRGRGIA